ncbi:hypothetical protein ABZP36_001783 [Zizania latifolia]
MRAQKFRGFGCSAAMSRARSAAAHVLPVFSGITGKNLTGGSWRGLRDVGCPAPSQELPSCYAETVLPSVRGFCSEPAERPISTQPNGMTDALKLIETEAEIPGSQIPAMDHSSDTKLQDKTNGPCLFQIVLDVPSNSFRNVLDKWIEDGNHLDRNEVKLVLSRLRKQRLYRKALQFMEWIERGKLLNFEEFDYACHLDLIARHNGIKNAQGYIKRVPLPFRNEVLYETLLVNCVCVGNIQKAEEVFKEIKDLSLPLTVSACNQMILLYKRFARGKVADILILMEKENIKPSSFTYKVMIDFKGRSNDLPGMELILSEMKACGIEPDVATQTMVAKFYMYGGLTEKAEAIVKELEMQLLKDHRHAIRSLLHLYAALNKPDDVARIWKLCTEPRFEDFLAAIKAWGQLGHIEQAEETFEALLKMPELEKLSFKFYIAMLNVYADNKLLVKGKHFVERMSRDGCPIGPLTWDAIINLYVKSGEVEKADSFLLNVAEENHDRRPLFTSYIVLMKAYAKRGDIYNTEKIFDRLKKVEYPGQTLPYHVLLEAYVNAKVPAYGFLQRMSGHKVRPTTKVYTDLRFLDTLQKEEALQG